MPSPALSVVMLAAIAASCVTTRRTPTEAEREDFRRRCSEADPGLLGHLLHTAGHPELERIAADEANRRLGEAVR